MALISTARALDDQRFLWRVRSAALALAVTKYMSATGAEKELAQHILDNPMLQNSTLEALVANNGPVNTATTVDATNAVSTEAVTDAQITTAVASYWPAVATRWAERKVENAPQAL